MVLGMVHLLQINSDLRVGSWTLTLKGRLYGTYPYTCCTQMPCIPFVAAHKLQGKLIHQSMQLNKSNITSY